MFVLSSMTSILRHHQQRQYDVKLARLFVVVVVRSIILLLLLLGLHHHQAAHIPHDVQEWARHDANRLPFGPNQNE